MRRNTILLLVVLLASCSKHEGADVMKKVTTVDIKNQTDSYKPTTSVKEDTSPKIAYTYDVTYEFNKRSVGQVQGQQIALCRRLGTQHCLMIKSTLNAPKLDDHFVTDEAVLLIDARMANEINQQLDALAIAGGATLSNRQVEAEDVTRQVIETDVRVRAKQALAERLLAIIRSGNGKVNELVEAEQAYAKTQEELDSAREEQASLAQRVAMSRISINYVFSDTPGLGSPIRTSFFKANETLSSSVAALFTAMVAILPWLFTGGIVITAVRWIRRKMGWRWPRRT